MRRVIVSAPARLHLGFVGLYGCSADQFGALGVAIEKPQTRVEATESTKTAVLGSMQMKVQQYVDTLIRELTLSRPFEITVSETIPAHIGLGSGTQLALAVATACIKLNGIDLPLEKLSSLLGRGDRSGIGTATFDSGGFLVDCAPENSDSSRSVSTRIEFPEKWRILLIFDDSFQGIHGISENSAFKTLGGFTAILTQELHNVLEKQVLPALQKQDIASFGEGITIIQNRVGDFFSSIQGGRFLSSEVSDILEYAANNGAAGIGQSSWGPTGFAIMENEAGALQLHKQLLDRSVAEGIRFEICQARNVGASITVEKSATLARKTMEM